MAGKYNKEKMNFEKNSLLLFCLMMGSNICNYFFQIVIGNLMSVEDYGITNTVMALMSVLSIPTTIITMISARYIALYSVTKDNSTFYSMLKSLFKFVVLIAGFILLCGSVGRSIILEVFNLESQGYVFGVLIIATVNLFLSVIVGVLQGLELFLPYGIQSILTVAGKLVLSIVLILLGCRVYGVITAVIFGVILAILYGLKYVGKYILGAVMYSGDVKFDIKEFIRYALVTIVAQACVITLTNGDILIVKVFFSDEVTGIYSSAMVIGKITMYVSTAIVTALFPMVVDRFSKGEKTIPLLKKALLYGGGMTLLCAFGLCLFGKLAIGILFANRYQAAVYYLPYVCAYIVPLTFITILMNYLLAIGKANFFGASISVGFICVTLCSFLWHKSVQELMLRNGILLILVFVSDILYLYYLFKKKIVT